MTPRREREPRKPRTAEDRDAELVAAIQAEHVRWISQLQTELSQSVGGVLLRGARVAQIETAHRPMTSGGALIGYSIRENAGPPGAAALVHLRDGPDAAGELVCTLALAAGESANAWFGPGGLNIAQGLFVHVETGSVAGAVYLRGTD